MKDLSTQKDLAIESIFKAIRRNADTCNQHEIELLISNSKKEINTILNALMKVSHLTGYMTGYDEGFDDCKHGRDQRVVVHVC